MKRCPWESEEHACSVGGYVCIECKKKVCGECNGTSDEDDPKGFRLCDRCWASRQTSHGARRQKQS